MHREDVRFAEIDWFNSMISLFINEDIVYAERSLIMGTLNQWNNMSGMFAALTGFFMIAYYIEKELKYKFLFLGMGLTSFIIMVSNISTFGFFITILFFGSFIAYLRLQKKWVDVGKQAVIIAVTVLITFLCSLSTTYLWEETLGNRIWNESFGNYLSLKGETKTELKDSETASQNEKPNTIQFDLERNLQESNIELPVLPEVGNTGLSSRIYIWEKTLGLLKERPLFGYGMDTLIYYFPHYNIDARAGISTENLIVDKPHSLYISILYGTGIIGALLVLVIGVLSIKKVIFQVKREKAKDKWPFIVLIVMYLMQASMYDSVIGSTFIVVLGIILKTNDDSKPSTSNIK